MADSNPIDHVIAIPTFIGSLLSFLGSATAIGFQVARPPQRHFRHSLIMNLLVADMVYGLCNTISGAVFLAEGRTPSPRLEPPVMCKVSGWFSQSNAQAVDFNILIISIVVLLSVVKKNSIASIEMRWQVCLCLLAWIPGFITATIGLALGSYGYVSGNWCWIRNNRLDLRYGLSHGWRIAIFFVTLAIYTYIYMKLKRVLRNLRSLSGKTLTNRKHDDSRRGGGSGGSGPSDSDNDTQKILVAHSVSVSHEMSHLPPRSSVGTEANTSYGSEGVSQATATATFDSSRSTIHNDDDDDDDNGGSNSSSRFMNSRMPAGPNLKKMLLMNGYPLAYIILWIPGIANRLTESVGGRSPRWLSALQACTQYIGLVNALTYGMSEQMRRGVWKKIKDTGRSG